MKKYPVLIMVFVLTAALLIAKNAFCYTLLDSTNDSIGYPTFELYRMEVNQSGSNITFDIFTNYPGVVTVGDWHTFAADLAIDADRNGSYEYGVAFTNHDGLTAGSLYKVDSWHVSNEYYPNPTKYSYIYNQNKIVTIDAISGSAIDSGSVNWNGPGASYPYYQISTTLNADDFLPDGFNGNINVYYATATCANDFMSGSVPVSNPVPEPATLSLLSLGLLGLAKFRNKQ